VWARTVALEARVSRGALAGLCLATGARTRRDRPTLSGRSPEPEAQLVGRLRFPNPPKGLNMTIPRRYAPVLFSGLVSVIMVTIVTAVVVLVNVGPSSAFFANWLRSFAITWPVAFLTLSIVAPVVRRFVDKVTAR
jgi:hypothetical protein